MATQAGITAPILLKTPGNMFVQKGPVSDGSNTFIAGALVKRVAGTPDTIVACGNDEVLIFGQVPDISHASTEIPPQALFGENHYVFDPLGGIFAINVGLVTAGAIITGSTAQTPSQFAVGTAYGIAIATVAPYVGVQVLDFTETTNTLFTVVGKIDGEDQSNYNGRVLVTPIVSKIQA